MSPSSRVPVDHNVDCLRATISHCGRIGLRQVLVSQDSGQFGRKNRRSKGGPTPDAEAAAVVIHVDRAAPMRGSSGLDMRLLCALEVHRDGAYNRCTRAVGGDPVAIVGE